MENDVVTTDEKTVASTFNKHYINIVEIISFRKYCVRINDTDSEFENIVTGVPRGSILGPFLLNLSIND